MKVNINDIDIDKEKFSEIISECCDKDGDVNFNKIDTFMAEETGRIKARIKIAKFLKEKSPESYEKMKESAQLDPLEVLTQQLEELNLLKEIYYIRMKGE